jgi:cell division protein FtsW
MARKLASDKILFTALVALSFFGCVMIYSASAVPSAQAGGSPYRYLARQLLALVVGGAAAFVLYRIDYRHLRRKPVVYALLAGAIGLCVLALLAPPINGARRWLGIAGFSLQPSEFAKIALLVFLAYQLERKRDRLADPWRTLAPCAIGVGLIAALVGLEPDLGTALLYVILAGVLFWLAGVPGRYFFVAGACVFPAVALFALSAGYRRDRLVAFLHPGSDPLKSGFQAMQSLIAVGAGGLTGTGLGQSRQKLFFLPYPYSDFIFSIVGEELGFIGAAALVILFAIVAWRGLRAAFRAPEPFAAYLAAGATALIVLQAAINMSVVLTLLPTKGIPLPFVSYGGSSLVANWMAAGLLLNISQHEQ